MTTIIIYRNKRNEHKYIEVRNDGHYHNTVRQFIFTPSSGVLHLTGDGMLHRWRKEPLQELLEDYNLFWVGNERFERWFSKKAHAERLWYRGMLRKANRRCS